MRRTLVVGVGFVLWVLLATPAAASTERALISWDTATDIDLHVVDAEGNHAFYGDTEAIPDAVLSPDDTSGFGPETFTDNRTPSDRSFCIRSTTTRAAKARPLRRPT